MQSAEIEILDVPIKHRLQQWISFPLSAPVRRAFSIMLAGSKHVQQFVAFTAVMALLLSAAVFTVWPNLESMTFLEFVTPAIQFVGGFGPFVTLLASTLWFLLWLLPKPDPLEDTAVTSFKFVPATPELAGGITEIAHSWFGSKNLGGRQARRTYFEELMANNDEANLRPAPFYALLEVTNDGAERLVGYTAVLALNAAAYESHRSGDRSQYDLTAKDLWKKGEPGPKRLYIQAIAIHPARRRSKPTKMALKAMLADHLGHAVGVIKDDFPSYSEGLNEIAIYGEEFSEGGRRFVESLGGGVNADRQSADRNPIMDVSLSDQEGANAALFALARSRALDLAVEPPSFVGLR
ncbi:MAG: hypothetical protein AAFX09_11365 [Pseudomonadota bacterium]